MGVAHRLSEQGESIKMWIQEPHQKMSGKGNFERVTSWRPHLSWADLVICDDAGMGSYEDTLKKLGKVVFSCNKLADMFQEDDEKKLQLFDKVGINHPLTFKWSHGIDIEWSESGFRLNRFPFRNEDIFQWAISNLKPGDDITVQEIVEGIEVTTEGWFNGRDWIKPFNHSFKDKYQANEDLGVDMGCMGNVVITSKGENKLAQETIMKLKPFLTNIGYRGPVSIDAVVNEEGVYAIEAKAGLGYDAIEALLEGLQEPAIDLFFETAIGVKKEMSVGSDQMISVRMYVTPEAPLAGMPIVGLNEHNLKHIFLSDVFKDAEGYKYSYGNGLLLKATASGRNIKEARNRVYRTLTNLTALGKQYRTDIGKKVPDSIARLEALGYL